MVNLNLLHVQPAPDRRWKRCSACKKVKERDHEFYHRASGGTRSQCADCCVARIQRFKLENPTKAREYNQNRMWRLQGIDFDCERYAAMLIAQDSRCAICNCTSDRTLHLDHIHGTDRVRALLCGPCNQGLGSFKDSPERLRCAAKYLESFK